MDNLTIRDISTLAVEYADRARSWMDISNLFTKHIYLIYSGMEQKDFSELWSSREDVCYMVNGKGFSGQRAVYDCYVSAKDAVRASLLETLAELVPGQSFRSENDLGAGEYELHVPMVPYIQVAKDNLTAKAVWSSPGVACHVKKDGTCHSYIGTVVYAVDFIREADGWKIWHLREDDEFAAEIPLSVERTLKQAMSGQPAGPGAGGPPKLEKETILRQLAEGQSPAGRTGEVIRTLKGLPPSAPESNLHMGDRAQASLVRPNRFIDDIVDPYETWSEKLSVIRDY